MIDAITSRGYCVEIDPNGVTICHKTTGDMAMFSTIFEAWKYTEGWSEDEP